MKRMLINATQEEELRVAMVDGQRIYDLNIELPSAERKKANIYKGEITRIEPSLEAAFVDYGAERHGFLPLKEISSEYFVKNVDGGKPNIKDVLKEGQPIVVQIDKEERGNKGAALTTFVSLAGRFIVLKPNKMRSGGVSRRIVGEDRDLARESLRDVNVPDGMSVILRTAGIDRSAEELEWDLNNLMAVWQAIFKVVAERPSPFLIYRESNAVVRALRDYLTSEIGEILIDSEAAYKEAHEFVEQVMPHNLRKLKHYVDPVPLFTRYQIESQIESAFAHSVSLPSGGSLVIDHTEALVSIDINSARATKGGDIEATALNTNLEAADEVGRQLRLRDLGGLVVIDFIDMGPQKAQREVEHRLRDAVRQDRARVQIGNISRFGLLEMSRQRLRPSLGESAYLTCPRCSGIGNIRSVESLALAILRIIGEEARKERTAKVIAQLPAEVATYLLNEKRDWVQGLESKNDTEVILVANSLLETPHYQVRRVRDDQVDLPENIGNSYALSEAEEEQIIPEVVQSKQPTELAAIATVTPTAAPARQEKKGPSLWERIKQLFAGDQKKKSRGKPRGKQSQQHRRSDSRRRGGQRSRGRSDSQRPSEKRGGEQRKGQPRKKQTQNKRANKQQGKKTADNRAGANAEQKKTEKQSRSRDDNRDDNRGDNRKTASKRRSRGGRRRRRSGENADAAAADTQQTVANETQTHDAAPEAPRKDERAERIPAAEEKAEATAPATATDTAIADKDLSEQKRPQPEDKSAKAEEAISDKPAETEKPKKPRVRKSKPKPASEKPTHSAGDTQPELPPQIIPDEPASEKPMQSKSDDDQKPAKAESAAKPAEKRSEKPAEKPADKPAEKATAEKASEQPASGNGDNKPQETAAAKPDLRSDGEPKGRLMPWDAPAESGKPTSSDEDKAPGA